MVLQIYAGIEIRIIMNRLTRGGLGNLMAVL